MKQVPQEKVLVDTHSEVIDHAISSSERKETPVKSEKVICDRLEGEWEASVKTKNVSENEDCLNHIGEAFGLDHIGEAFGLDHIRITAVSKTESSNPEQNENVVDNEMYDMKNKETKSVVESDDSNLRINEESTTTAMKQKKKTKIKPELNEKVEKGVVRKLLFSLFILHLLGLHLYSI